MVINLAELAAAGYHRVQSKPLEPHLHLTLQTDSGLPSENNDRIGVSVSSLTKCAKLLFGLTQRCLQF